MRLPFLFPVLALVLGLNVVSALPLQFVENEGQWDAGISFAAYRLGAVASLGREGIEFAGACRADEKLGRLMLRFDGTAGVLPCGEEPRQTSYHFVTGTQDGIRRLAPRGYESILYEDLYPGISLRVRAAAPGEAGVLAYDVLVAAGAAIDTFCMRCEGIESLDVLPDGSLMLTAGDLTVRQAAPVAWQDAPSGGRRFVAARFRIVDDHRVGFEVDAWDPTLPGVIDPAVQFGTHLGGTAEEYAFNVLVDDVGNFVVVGFGQSLSPVAGRYDAFVAVLDPWLMSLLSLTILAGAGDDRAMVIESLGGGIVVVGGWTASNDFPIVGGAPDTRFGGSGEGFVTVLEPMQGTIMFSSYVGGAGDDCVTSVAVDAEGRVLVAGHTFSPDPGTWFDPPAASGFMMTRAGESDSFLCRLDVRQIGQAAVPVDYFTLVGGAGRESWGGEYFDTSRIELRRNSPKIALLPDGTVAMMGITVSSNFPTTATAYQPSLGGTEDIFLARIRPDATLPAGEQLPYATYLGGNSTDCPLGISVDSTGDVWLTGYTWSTSYPVTANALQPRLVSEDDVFVTRLRPDPGLPRVEQLAYSTYFGGSAYEWGHDIEVGGDGSVTVVGHSDSLNLPLSEPGSSTGLILSLRPVDGGSGTDMELGYAARVGSGFTLLTGVRAMPAGKYALVGYSAFTFPGLPADAYQPICAGNYDALVLVAATTRPIARFTASPVLGGVPLEVSVDASASEGYEGAQLTGYHWDFGDGSTAEGVQMVHTYTAPGRYVITLRVTTDVGTQDSTHSNVSVWCGPCEDMAPWQAADIGSPLFPGSSWKDREGISVCAGGRTNISTRDEFHYVHQEMHADFSAVVKVEEPLSWILGARLGLMARGSMQPDAPFAALLVQRYSTETRLMFRFRTEGVLSARAHGVPTLPLWLKIERRGQEILASSSPEGDVWTEVDRQVIAFGSGGPVLGGLAACGNDTGDPLKSFAPLRAHVTGLAVALAETFRRG
ncbi:MAG TPA: hypothetical protein DCM87_12015, partial [Planctomycetes bacterium]|nr:hypothetical protein [Planctomycetota bacterium]